MNYPRGCGHLLHLLSKFISRRWPVVKRRGLESDWGSRVMGKAPIYKAWGRKWIVWVLLRSLGSMLFLPLTAIQIHLRRSPVWLHVVSNKEERSHGAHRDLWAASFPLNMTMTPASSSDLVSSFMMWSSGFIEGLPWYNVNRNALRQLSLLNTAFFPHSLHWSKE